MGDSAQSRISSYLFKLFGNIAGNNSGYYPPLFSHTTTSSYFLTLLLLVTVLSTDGATQL